MTKEKPKVLYVEDDVYLGYVTKDNLEQKGYDIVLCKNGEDALKTFQEERFDLCILDIMLPEMDGFHIAREIRKTDHHIPILFLSAKSMKEDRIKGLTIGGDDYLTKPFSIEELVLKIEIFLKRNKVSSSEASASQLIIGDYIFDKPSLRLIHNEFEKRLTSREAALLVCFYRNQNKVVKKEDILNEVWGSDSYFNSRSLDVFISKLRKYLQYDPKIQINNIHGIGFIMVLR